MSQKVIVQRYLAKPLLLNGLKFDLRVYVLITSCDPLRLFIYREGLARFATVPYQQPDSTNMGLSYQHLTNYSLNKDNPDFR